MLQHFVRRIMLDETPVRESPRHDLLEHSHEERTSPIEMQALSVKPQERGTRRRTRTQPRRHAGPLPFERRAPRTEFNVHHRTLRKTPRGHHPISTNGEAQ